MSAILLQMGLLTVGLSKVWAAEVNINGLMNTVFQNYQKDVKPMCSDGAGVRVFVGLALRQLIDLDEPSQRIELNAWLRLRWHDCGLKWNATEYGVDSIIIPVDRIWVPDITLYDNVGEKLTGLKDYRPVLFSNGDVAYNFPTIITSMCPVDVTFFPFDTQKCPLQFGSWAYNGFEIDVVNLTTTGDLASYVPSVEWTVENVPVVRHVIIYGCCVEPYPDVTFYIILRRKPLFHMMSLIFPCMLITAVTCLGFMLPPDSGEKVSLEVTVLLSLAVFLLVVSETMPPSSEKYPYIGVYFAGSMLLVSLSCLSTVMVLSIHYKGSCGKEMPLFIKKIFLGYLAKLVGIDTVRRRARRCSMFPTSVGNMFSYNNDSFVSNGTEKSEAKLQSGLSISTIMEDICSENAYRVDSYNDSSSSEVVKTLQRQLQSIINIEKNLAEQYQTSSIVEEWRLLAQVLDRVFLMFFFSFMVLSTMAILIRSSEGEG